MNSNLLTWAQAAVYDSFLASMALALLLGSFIGVERQWHRRLVDLKTNALVSLGACLFMLVTKTADGYSEPVRMGAQIVVGVGFIGGGLLFKDAGQTRGINTAATLWCCAAVGTLCGLERAPEAWGATVIILLANTVLRRVAQFLNLKMGVSDHLTQAIRFELTCLPGDADLVRSLAQDVFRQGRVEVRALAQGREGDHAHLGWTVLFEQGNALDLAERFFEQIGNARLITRSWSSLP
jgi:putative Mg2+ transporter-C (MgtC) family protein